MRGILVVTLVVFSVFAAQLVKIQGFESGDLAKKALTMRLAQNVTLPAQRGRILSSDGSVLAVSLPRVAVVADPQNVCLFRDPDRPQTCNPAHRPAAVKAAATALAPVLKTTVADLTKRLSVPGRFAILDRSVAQEDWRRVQSLKIPGIYESTTEAEAVRSYPQAGASAALVGYLKRGEAATGGLEALGAKYLAGTPGKASYELAADGSIIPAGEQKVAPAVNGSDVTTTINANIQWYAQNAIAAQVRKTGALSGTAIVQDARTGDLLAVASAPTFDPNHVRNTAGTFSDPAFSDVFEPGSTAKVMTVAAALEEGGVTPTTPIIIPNTVRRADRTFRDSHDHPTEYRTVAGALAESSNIGTMLISETLAPKTLESYFRSFGVGSRSGVGFPGETSGLFAKSEDWDGSQRYTVVYGQGVAVTAVQATSVFQTIANGGVRVQPRLLSSVTTPEGVSVPLEASPTKRVVTPQVAAQVTAMLEGAASKEGTAPEAMVAGYRVAGKTGTADRADGHGGYSGKTASFIGFAPADAPRLVIGIFLQRPVRGYFGGTVAAPVFHDIMQYSLQALAIPPTGTKPAPITLKLSTPPSTSNGLVLRDGVTPTAR